MRRPFSILLGALTLVAPFAVAQAPSHPSELYLKHCQQCHGPDGKAQTEDGEKLGAEVFANPKWREKKRPKIEKLINSVTLGKGKKMPSFKDKLTPEQIRLIVEKDVLGDWK